MTHTPIVHRGHNNFDTEENSNACMEHNNEPSLTIQSMSEDADINVLMKRYGLTGVLPQNPRVPTYQDFEDVFDFRTANEAIMNANAAFMEYPADLRARFGNDPQRLMEFISDGANLEEAKKLGLVKETPKPSKVEPVRVIIETPTAEPPK